MTEERKAVLVKIGTRDGKTFIQTVSFTNYVLFENWYLVKPIYVKHSANRYPYAYFDNSIFKLIGREGTTLLIKRGEISSVQSYFV